MRVYSIANYSAQFPCCSPIKQRLKWECLGDQPFTSVRVTLLAYMSIPVLLLNRDPTLEALDLFEPPAPTPTVTAVRHRSIL